MIRWLPAGRLRPVALAVVAWVVGAASAVAVGLVSLSFVNAGLLGPADPLAPADPLVAPSATPERTPAVSATPTAGDDHTVNSPGGTVVARCIGGDAYLVLWSPAPGFHTGDITRGPAATARVTFESRNREIKVRITCPDGVLHNSVHEEWESDR